MGTVVLPRLLEHRPLSLPIIYVALGLALFAVFPGTPELDPIANADVVERHTELVVIISLMGAGLKLDRPFDWRSWSSAPPLDQLEPGDGRAGSSSRYGTGGE